VAVVAAGHDAVADAGLEPVAQSGAVGFDEASGGAVGAGPVIQRSDGLDVPGDEQGRLAGRLVVGPGGVGAVEDGVPVAAVDPVVRLVDIQHGGLADAEADGGGAFPGVGEPAGGAEFGDTRATVAGKEAEGAACVDRGELGPVPDEEELGTGLAGARGDPVQRRRARQRGFVQDDELPRLEPPRLDLRL